MRSILPATLLVVAVSLLAGCAPDPTEACDHMIAVMADDPEKPTFLQDDDKCHKRMESIKVRYGVNSYRREIECALQATTGYQLRTCFATEERRR